MGCGTEIVKYSSRMAIITKDKPEMITWKVLAFMSGPTETAMRENLKMGNSMEKASFCIPAEIGTKERSAMEENTDMVSIFGL